MSRPHPMDGFVAGLALDLERALLLDEIGERITWRRDDALDGTSRHYVIVPAAHVPRIVGCLVAVVDRDELVDALRALVDAQPGTAAWLAAVAQARATLDGDGADG